MSAERTRTCSHSSAAKNRTFVHIGGCFSAIRGVDGATVTRRGRPRGGRELPGSGVPDARRTVPEYQVQFPGLEDRFETFDLLQPEFTELTLNRNRLFDYGYVDAPGRPHASEKGTVTNALYEVANGRSGATETEGTADD